MPHRDGYDIWGVGLRLQWDASNPVFEGSRAPETEPNPRRRILPPLVDIQLNGYAGIDINASDVQPDGLLRMAREIWRTGVVFFFPTVVTGSAERMERSIRILRQTCHQDPQFSKSVPGIHVEGPYISPEDGPRGAHPLAHVRPPDWDEFQRWQDAADGTIRMLTLSPEWENAPEFIERVAESGVVVAIGHTKATAEQLNAAVVAGARTSTHLGNGAHATIPRHPNYIWEQLGDDRLWASFIADGHHLPPATLKSMLRAKTSERSVLTSDAVWVAGMPAGCYSSFEGKDIEVLPNGRVQLAGTPYLAGAGMPLIRGIENAVKFAGLEFGQAVLLASERPAVLMGMSDTVSLQPGNPANMTIADWDGEHLTIVETILDGETLFGASASF